MIRDCEAFHHVPVPFPDAAFPVQLGIMVQRTFADGELLALRVAFSVRLADGIPRHGIYVDHENLALSDGDPAVWADTIAWVLNLLPLGTRTIAMRGDGPTIADLPAQILTTDSITAFFLSLP